MQKHNEEPASVSLVFRGGTQYSIYQKAEEVSLFSRSVDYKVVCDINNPNHVASVLGFFVSQSWDSSTFEPLPEILAVSANVVQTVYRKVEKNTTRLCFDNIPDDLGVEGDPVLIWTAMKDSLSMNECAISYSDGRSYPLSVPILAPLLWKKTRRLLRPVVCDDDDAIQASLIKHNLAEVS